MTHLAVYGLETYQEQVFETLRDLVLFLVTSGVPPNAWCSQKNPAIPHYLTIRSRTSDRSREPEIVGYSRVRNSRMVTALDIATEPLISPDIVSHSPRTIIDRILTEADCEPSEPKFWWINPRIEGPLLRRVPELIACKCDIVQDFQYSNI